MGCVFQLQFLKINKNNENREVNEKTIHSIEAHNSVGITISSMLKNAVFNVATSQVILITLPDEVFGGIE